MISGFTLMELILILALLVIITSLAAPEMARFIRGRALDAEARRMLALMHAGQSRAVSEGMPMMFWVDEKAGTYGVEAESSGQRGATDKGDAKAEELTVDSTLQESAPPAKTGVAVMFKNLPAIRFLPDGTVDENSLPAVRLEDSAGFVRWLKLNATRMGYEISDTGN